MLHEYAVGKYGDIFGDNTGRLLKKGTRLRYDMHYFAVGSEQHNKTTIAFKFYPKGVTPKYQVRSQNIRNIPNDELEVPPNTVVRTDGYFRLPRPARIDSFQPHMHMRGRGLTVEAIDPVTNKTFILSSVDHFDFNWHINYVYADDAAPLLPAGTVLHLIGIHDNTSANRRNPDPNMWVGFGERSVDDMLQVWLDMVYLDEAEYQRLVEERKSKPTSSTTAQLAAAAIACAATVPQAGGIAFRGAGRDLSILLVTSKKQPGFWIFPKGHIEPGETAAEAGVRETEEEAGVTGDLLGPVGAPLEYDWNGKRYSVQYFLIRATSESPASDGRHIAWLPSRKR